jgi:hypothetical protein
MACNTDYPEIRARIGRVLKTNACSQIRFRLANIYIGRFMFNYIAGMIENGSVNITTGDTAYYDVDTNTLKISASSTEAEIVHETTHILINATHKGATIRRGDHETAAYLSAALWALYSDNEIAVDVPHMDVHVRRLANKILAFNTANRSGTYDCAPADYLLIQSLMQASANGTDVNERKVQPGLSLCAK